jgi:hypothetical protein
MLAINQIFSKLDLPLSPLVSDYNPNQIIRSVTIVESTDVTSWLHGGEFLILSDETLLKITEPLVFLQNLTELRVGGLAIKKTSNKRISKEFVRFAQEKRFPLFTFTKEVTYLQIMTPINELLFKKDEKVYFRNNAAELLLSSKKIRMQELYLPDISLSEQSQILVMKTKLNRDFSLSMNVKFRFSLIEALENLKYKEMIQEYIFLEEINNWSVLIFQESVKSRFNKREISNFFTDLLSFEVPFFFGVSDYRPVQNAFEANQQAQFAYQLRNLLSQKQKFLLYSEVEFYQLIDEINQSGKAKSLFSTTEILEETPLLLETLIAYFHLNESIKLTSEKLFVHINTLRYRLSRIQTLTGLDVFKTSDKVKLFLAVIHINNQKVGN